MKFTRYVVCNTKGCAELVLEPKKIDEKVYCPKCQKKKLKK